MTVIAMPINNVVRFPIERRLAPTMGLVFKLAPDDVDVWKAIELHDLEVPASDVRAETDQNTAQHVAGNFGGLDAAARADALDGLLAVHVGRAVNACLHAETAARVAAEATLSLDHAKKAPDVRLIDIEGRAGSATRAAAEALVEANRLCEAAKGAARAIDIARTGALWHALTIDEQAEALCRAQDEAMARRKA